MKAYAPFHLRSRSDIEVSSTSQGHKLASAVISALCAVIAIVAMPSTRAASMGGRLSIATKGAIPYGKHIYLSPHGFTSQFQIANSTNSLYANAREAVAFLLVDKGAGRVALFGNGGFVSVDTYGIVSLRRGAATKAEIFRWIETTTGEFTLLSLNSHKYLRVDAATGAVWANGTLHEQTNATDGVVFDWKIVTETPNQPPTREPTQ